MRDYKETLPGQRPLPRAPLILIFCLVLLATLALPAWLSERDREALADDRAAFQRALRAELAGRQCPPARHRLEDVQLILRPAPDPQTNAITWQIECLYVSGAYGTRPRYRTAAPTHAGSS